MSDQITPFSADEFAADRRSETLDNLYRAALLDRSVDADTYRARLSEIEAQIVKHCGSQKAGWAFIDSITHELDREAEIDIHREKLQAAFETVSDGIGAASAAIAALGADNVYDAEIAEGDTDAMQAALTGLRLNLAALRHLTRDATPENKP
jgi:hypothetical protein